MNLIEQINKIPIINDHTHIFGAGNPQPFAMPGQYAQQLTIEGLLAQLSGLNMRETAMVALEDSPEQLHQLQLKLFETRKTAYPIRAMTAMFREKFGFTAEEINSENIAELVELLKAKLPPGTEALYKYLGQLGNTEVFFCNHGHLGSLDKQTTKGLFRWVPYYSPTQDTPGNDGFVEIAEKMKVDIPTTVEQARELFFEYVKRLKASGAVAIKTFGFAYSLNRPFAPDLASLDQFEDSINRVCRDQGSAKDQRILEDVGCLLIAEAAGEVGLPIQIHVGLIWTARNGPTRLPNICELTPVFYAYPKTTFVIFHGGYPYTDQLAYIAATMSNVRAEFNWVPFWSGMDFANMIGKWIDMIPNDRILYGTDGDGLVCVAHDMVTRTGLAQALQLRIEDGNLSKTLALQLAANILRNNAIDAYNLDLPKYNF